MEPSAYVESTILSYLAARPSRDLVIAAFQAITREWWSAAPNKFELFVSDAVLAEISQGDRDAVARRLKFAHGLPSLELDDEIRALAKVYEEDLGLPAKARTDALHIACTVCHEIDYLVTWNCTHLANGEVVRKLMERNLREGLFTPLIVTPAELVESQHGE